MNALRNAILTTILVSVPVVATMCGNAPASAQSAGTAADTLARAQATFAEVLAGKIDRDALTPALSADLTNDVLAGMTRQVNAIAKAGAFAAVAHAHVDGVTTTVYRIPSSTGTIDFTFGIDDTTGKVAKLYFVAGPDNRGG